MKYVYALSFLWVLASADFIDGPQGGGGAFRQGKQARDAVTGGIDFSRAEFDPETGKQCVIAEDEVQSIEKEPILECNHKNVEKCHYTYVTQFKPAQEEVCEENFEKKCQITFKKQAMVETLKKCYRPLEKVCDGQGPRECRTLYESSCTTRYIEKKPGKFVGDTRCEKLPVEICGNGCTTNEGAEECHDKEITSLIDVPEEVCDLNPQKTCRLQTKLVPSLKPEHECTVVPQEVCNLRFTQPKLQKKPLLTKWCLDDSPSPPAETYDEAFARAPPVRAGRNFLPKQISKRGSNIHNERRQTTLEDTFLQQSFEEAFPFETQQFDEFTDVSQSGFQAPGLF